WETDNFGVSNYENFWNLTPRAFFLLLTNYIGLGKSGFVIDRFTGDEVWNQPLVGYRFEKLTPDSLGYDPDSQQHYVQLTVTIYWAYDGVEGAFLSAVPFDINKIDQWLETKPDYES